jgi:hypothetical protein
MIKEGIANFLLPSHLGTKFTLPFPNYSMSIA